MVIQLSFKRLSSGYVYINKQKSESECKAIIIQLKIITMIAPIVPCVFDRM